MSSSFARVLSSDEERCTAGEIVRRRYEAQGYDISSDSFAKYLNEETAKQFGLFAGDVLYGTISIVYDSASGLPMDAIYRDELSGWRSEGKVLAEAVQFAVDPELCVRATGRRPSPLSSTPLFGAVLADALARDIDYLCISINPKHDRFYALLGFKKFGDLKHYGSVNAPAIARALEVRTWESNPLLLGVLGREIRKHMPTELGARS